MVVKNSNMDHNVVASSGFMEILNFMGILVIMALLDRQISTMVAIDPSIKEKAKPSTIKVRNIITLNQLYMIFRLEFLVVLHDGGSSLAIICQLCSQQGHTAANCVYKSNDVSENC